MATQLHTHDIEQNRLSDIRNMNKWEGHEVFFVCLFVCFVLFCFFSAIQILKTTIHMTQRGLFRLITAGTSI